MCIVDIEDQRTNTSVISGSLIVTGGFTVIFLLGLLLLLLHQAQVETIVGSLGRRSRVIGGSGS